MELPLIEMNMFEVYECFNLGNVVALVNWFWLLISDPTHCVTCKMLKFYGLRQNVYSALVTFQNSFSLLSKFQMNCITSFY
jgi:hypothetical protein